MSFEFSLNVAKFSVSQTWSIYIHYVRKKMEPIVFRHNFDKNKCIVVVFGWNVVKVMRNKLTQQMSATPKQRHYFVLCIEWLSCIKVHNIIIDNCTKIRPEYQLFNSTRQQRLQRLQLSRKHNITVIPKILVVPFFPDMVCGLVLFLSRIWMFTKSERITHIMPTECEKIFFHIIDTNLGFFV